MTNGHKITVIHLLTACLLFTAAQQVYANGAVWNPGTTTGTPGPVKQSALILEEERVDIENGANHIERVVTAWFNVKNPTKSPISVKMGFPIDYSSVTKKGYVGYLGSFAGKVEVDVNDETVPFTVTKDAGNAYSAIIQWDMIFAPGENTEFEVTYPARIDEAAGDEGVDDESAGGGSHSARTFRYITHTGAFWAAPIGKATITYCDKTISERMYREPHHSSSVWSNDGTEQRSVNWDLDIKPNPFHLDIANHCIIWERKNWVPKKPDDDIEIKVSERNYTSVYETPRIMYRDVDFLRLWCGLDARGRKGQQIADLFGVADKKMGIELYLDIEKKAYYHPESPPVYKNGTEQLADGKSLDAQPAHLKSDFQLKLLRYLRNYLHAIHGHKFKNPDLAECFHGVRTRGSWTDVEKWNVEWLVDYERQIKELNKWAWEKIENSSSE